VQRPFAARRLGAGAVDRHVATGSFLLVAIVMVCAVAFTHAPLPATVVRDPAAARDLVSLMHSGERGGWIVTYDFTRTLAGGRTLRQHGDEGRSSSLHVIILGAAMTIERGGRTFTCAIVGDRSGCRKTSDGAALPESAVVRVAVATGAYDVVRTPDTTIAGLRARCFRMRATGQGSLPDFGVETDRCLSDEGIPLRLFVVRPPGTINEQVTTAVRRRATPAQVKTLAAAFGEEAAILQR
jgi:hypothetical protein